MSPDEQARALVGVDLLGLILKQGALASDPDAVLVALGRKFEALSAELATLQNEEEALASSDRRVERSEGRAMINPLIERIEGVLRLLDPIERAIMAVPATTVVGLGVKARHAAQVLSNYWTDTPERLDWDARAVRLLIESTCNVAGVDFLPSRR
jgi:hypothetical protein